jgi:uncharacterized protein YabE (DUF348 family)
MTNNRVLKWYAELTTIAKVGVVSAFGIAAISAGNVMASPPLIEHSQLKTTETVQFATTYQDDDSMLITDKHVVITPGVTGKKNVVYDVTYTNHKETSRKIAKEDVLVQPVAQIEKVGTREVVNETANEPEPFTTNNVNDASMNKGSTKIVTVGVDGTKVVTYAVTKIKGVEVSREKISEKVAKSPIAQVVAVGTKVMSNCDSNYSGGCVPIASDVDCGGGSGNGPAYFYGTARVVGYDIYGLDRDGDGIACE